MRLFISVLEGTKHTGAGAGVTTDPPWPRAGFWIIDRDHEDQPDAPSLCRGQPRHPRRPLDWTIWA